MSDVNLDFTVSNNNINFTVTPNDITITPTDVQLSIYTGGISTVASGLVAPIGNVHITGGTAGEVLQTDGTGNLSWANVANATYANYANYAGNAYNLNATSVSNVVIGGGTNGYVLQTDGAGHLTWTAQTGGGGSNGTPGGSNTQVQFNDASAFGGNVGFTFNKITGNLNAPTVIGNINTSNLISNGTANLGYISNVKITGGTNGQIISTDGNGNLSWSNPSVGTDWSNVANINVNGLFFGQYGGSVNSVQPGGNVSITTSFNANSFTIANASFNLYKVTSTNNYVWARTADGTANLARVDPIGTTWSKVTTPFTNPSGPIQAGNNIVIYKSGSNAGAYSTNDGANWITANNINTTLNLGNSAFGSNTIIITRSETTSNNYIKSSDFGVTWSNSDIGSQTFRTSGIAYGNGKFMTNFSGLTLGKITSDLGNTWSNITLPNAYLWRSIAYGNGKWVSVSEYTGPTTRGCAIVSTDEGNTWTTTLLANLQWEDVTYTNGYFIASETTGNIILSTDGLSWTTVNTNLGNTAPGGQPAGTVAFNSKNSQLIVASISSGGYSNTAVTLTPKIQVTSADGNSANSQLVPLGTYKNLGGSLGNVGAMWIRTA
jgi:hypothetical protein